MADTASPWVYDVTEANFERDVLQRSQEVPVVIDFWAEWCGPCRVLGPMLERLVNERNGEVVLAKVNVEEAQQLAAAFGIQSIPAVKAIRDSQLVLEFTGALPEEHLREFLNQISGSPTGQQTREAAMLEADDPAEAERLYREVLRVEPNDDAARVGLARLLLAQGKDSEVLEVLEPVGDEGDIGIEAQRIRGQLSLKQIDAGDKGEAELRRQIEADPRNAQARYELGCLLAQAGKHRDALEMLYAAGERDFKLASSKVREAMVQVFYAIGTDHPLANEYRSKLALLLT